MYFGTGEKAINADAVRGAGIWQSKDGGLTWTIMPGTSNFWNVSKVICDAAGNLYVGCNSLSNTSGLQRYTKSTGTWQNITPTGLQARIADMVLSSTGKLHISCGYYNTASTSAGYCFTSNPATVTNNTWTRPTTPFTTQYNVALESKGDTLYVLPSNSAWQVPTIYKSTNGGTNWAAISTPAFTSGQSWYNMAVQIDPNNSKNVIVGGLDCYRTTNGGSTWTKISNWVGTTGQYVHADQQIILWNKSNRVLVGSDGGVHYSADGGTTFTDRNTGLRIKQFYSVAVHPTSTNYFLAGAQDNGTHQLNGAGLTSSVEVTGGDGAFVHIDQNQPQYQWGSYVYNQYRRSADGGASWSSINYSTTAGRFINPTDYDDVNNIMYASGVANAYIRWDNPQIGSTFTSVTMSGLNSGTVSAIKVSPYTNHTLFFAGGGSGITPSLIKVTSANATPVFTSIIGTGMTTASANISSIELGTDENNIIVTYSNYGVNNVWVTTDGGTSWTTIDGNLPDMPVRWAMFYPGDNSRAIIGTETGVWSTSSINGPLTYWDPESQFPNVRVDMLQYRSSDKTLVAATHGRGIFTTTLNTDPLSCTKPTGLNSTGITTSSATIGWTGSGTSTYTIDYKLASSTTWINAATATNTTSLTLTGLSSGSLYDFQVRAICTSSASAYTASQFTTIALSCGVVSGLTASKISSSSADLSWSLPSNTNLTDYSFQYKLTSSTTWISGANITKTTASLTGLSANSTYDYAVRANCNDGTGLYIYSQFTTLQFCGDVTGLAASAITNTTATLSWASLGGAVSYRVEYKLNTSTTWTTANAAATTTSINITGLTANSLYDYRVQANCSASTGSFIGAQFTTTNTIAPCGNVTGLAASSITTSGATLAWTALTGAASYDVDYQVFGASTWTNLISSTTARTISLTGLISGTRYSYRVRANCTNNSVPGSYTQAEFSTLAVCPTSTTDNSVNNTNTGAEILALNTERKSKIEIGNDVDYYRINITKTGTSTITLTTLPADYNLTLYNSTGTISVATSAKTGTTNESISYTFPSIGTYYIRINGGTTTTFNASLCYTLKVTLGTAQGTIAQLPITTTVSAITKIETEKEVDNNFSAKIYPNPTKDRVTVYVLGNNTKRTLTMYDATGKIVYKQGLNEMFTTLSLQKVPNGIYFIKIKSETGEIIYSERIIKN